MQECARLSSLGPMEECARLSSLGPMEECVRDPDGAGAAPLGRGRRGMRGDAEKGRAASIAAATRRPRTRGRAPRRGPAAGAAGRRRGAHGGKGTDGARFGAGAGGWRRLPSSDRAGEGGGTARVRRRRRPRSYCWLSLRHHQIVARYGASAQWRFFFDATISGAGQPATERLLE